MSRNREAGQTLPLICLFMFSLVGMCALVLDLGGAFVAKRMTQNAADATALAGVTQLNGNWSSTANGEFQQNVQHIPGATVTVSLATDFSSNDSVLATVDYQQPTYFAKLFGYNSIHVHSVARATAQSVHASSDAVPFGLFSSCTPTVGLVIPIYGGNTPCGQNTQSNVGTIVMPASGVNGPGLTCKSNGSPNYATVPAGSEQKVIDGSTPTGTLSVGDCVQTQTGKNPLSIVKGIYLVPILDNAQDQGHQNEYHIIAFEWVQVTADEQGKTLVATIIGVNDSGQNVTTGQYIPGYLNSLGLTQ